MASRFSVSARKPSARTTTRPSSPPTGSTRIAARATLIASSRGKSARVPPITTSSSPRLNRSIAVLAGSELSSSIRARCAQRLSCGIPRSSGAIGRRKALSLSRRSRIGPAPRPAWTRPSSGWARTCRNSGWRLARRISITRPAMARTSAMTPRSRPSGVPRCAAIARFSAARAVSPVIGLSSAQVPSRRRKI